MTYSSPTRARLRLLAACFFIFLSPSIVPSIMSSHFTLQFISFSSASRRMCLEQETVAKCLQKSWKWISRCRTIPLQNTAWWFVLKSKVYRKWWPRPNLLTEKSDNDRCLPILLSMFYLKVIFVCTYRWKREREKKQQQTIAENWKYNTSQINNKQYYQKAKNFRCHFSCRIRKPLLLHIKIQRLQ